MPSWAISTLHVFLHRISYSFQDGFLLGIQEILSKDLYASQRIHGAAKEYQERLALPVRKPGCELVEPLGECGNFRRVIRLRVRSFVGHEEVSTMRQAA